MAQARLESSREKAASGSPSPEKEPAAGGGDDSSGNTGGPAVILRQRSMTPRSRRENNRLSYIDNEIRFLDAEQQEIDRQAAILDKRLRYTHNFTGTVRYLPGGFRTVIIYYFSFMWIEGCWYDQGCGSLRYQFTSLIRFQ